MSCVICHVSCDACHVTYVHVTRYNYSWTVRARAFNVDTIFNIPCLTHVTGHLSCVTCQVAYFLVTCLLSWDCVTCQRFVVRYFMLFVVCAYKGQHLSITSVLKPCQTHSFYLLFIQRELRGVVLCLPINHYVFFAMKTIPHHDESKFLHPLPSPSSNLDPTPKLKIRGKTRFFFAKCQYASDN